MILRNSKKFKKWRELVESENRIKLLIFERKISSFVERAKSRF